MSEWKPISTFPEEFAWRQDDLLLWDGGRAYVGHAAKDNGTHSHWVDRGTLAKVTPTHWKPIKPPSPEETRETE